MIEQWRSYCADSPCLLSFLATAVKAQEFFWFVAKKHCEVAVHTC